MLEKKNTMQEDANSVKTIDVSQEDGAKKLAECEEILEQTTENIKRGIRAFGRICKEELFKFARDEKTGKPFEKIEDYVRARGFSRSWYCRKIKYAKGLVVLEIPEGEEPTEGAMRKLLSGGFSDEEQRKIHENAVTEARNNKREIPIAADYDVAINMISSSDQIFLSPIGKSVSRDVDFTTGVFKTCGQKIYSVGILLAVIKTFKTRKALSEEDQTAIRDFLVKLREKEDRRLEVLFNGQEKNADDMKADSVPEITEETHNVNVAGSGGDDYESDME